MNAKRLSLIGLMLLFSLNVALHNVYGCLAQDQKPSCPNTDVGCKNPPTPCKCTGGGPGGGGGPDASGAGNGTTSGGYVPAGFGGGGGSTPSGPPASQPIPLGSSGGGDSSATDADMGLQGANFTYDKATHGGSEIDAAKGFLQLRRVDMVVKANGGFNLAPARTHNNASWTSSQNTNGLTSMGPYWHFNYDMQVLSGGGGDLILRNSAGDSEVLVLESPGVWATDSFNGSALRCTLANNVYTITQPDPNIVYKFNLSGKLIEMRRDASGNKVTFQYNAAGKLSRADLDHDTDDIDPRYLEFEYTTTGTTSRLTEIRFQMGSTLLSRIGYRYDAYDRLWQVCDSQGRVIEEYVNGPIEEGSGTRRILEVRQPDITGQLRTTRKYAYDEWDCDFVEAVRVTDGEDRVLVQTERDGLYYSFSHMPNGTATCYQTDFSRNPVSFWTVDEATSGVVDWHVQEFVHDDQTTDPFALGAHNFMLPRAVYDASTTTTYEYVNEDDPNASNWDKIHVKSITRTDGSKTEYEYDPDYRVTAIKQPLDRITTMSYDSAGRLASRTDPMGNTTCFFYDNHGRLVRTEDATSASSQIAYNGIGQVTVTTDTEGRASLREYDSYGRLTTATAMGLSTVYAYDVNDLLTTVTDALGNNTVYTHDGLGRRIAVTDPLGNTTRSVYDEHGRLRNVIDANDEWTTYTHDWRGKLTSFTDQRNNNWEYGYDVDGRVMWERNPLQKTTTYTYFDQGCASCGAAPGKLATVTDPANRTTYYEYDLMGRKKRITWSGESDYVEYTYDDAGRRTAVLDTRLPKDDLGTQAFAWAYDKNDRVTSESYPTGDEIHYSYDALGQRTSMTDPDGNVTEYHYSNTANDKKLAYIEHPFSGRTNFYYSQDKGLLTEESYDMDLMVATVWGYDAMNRVSSIEVVNQDTVAIYHREAYTYNANSMRTRVDYQVAGQPNYHRLYAYDPVLRLTEQHKRWDANNATAWRSAYQYDPAGNRTQMVHFDGSTTRTVASSYNDGSQLTQNSDGTYSFDDNGNMVEHDLGSSSKHYRHNRENRLVQFEDDDSGAVVDYTYDAMGRRIMRTDAQTGQKLLYFYDGLNILMIKELAQSCSKWRTKNVYTLKQAEIGQIVSEREYSYPPAPDCTQAPTGYIDRWYQFDLLGNTVCTTLAGGTLESQPEMEAFGKCLFSPSVRFDLTTKPNDGDSDLRYFGARWYDPILGQFVQESPRARVAEAPYDFALGNPVSFVDTDGLSAVIVLGGALAGGVVGHAAVSIADVPPSINNCSEYTCYYACMVAMGVASGAVAGKVGVATDAAWCASAPALRLTVSGTNAGLAGLVTSAMIKCEKACDSSCPTTSKSPQECAQDCSHLAGTKAWRSCMLGCKASNPGGVW